MEEVKDEDFFAKIFSEDPKDPGKVKLELEGVDDIDGLANFLAEFFQKGCHYLFSKGGTQKVALERLTTQHLDLLQKYFNSIGMQFFMFINDKPFYNKVEIEDNDLNKRSLDFHLGFNGKTKYSFCFDFAPF